MPRTRPLRWYQQLRWKLPAIYLLLVVTPTALLLSAGFVMGGRNYQELYRPETFFGLASAKAPQAAELLAEPPVSPAAAEILLEDLNEELLAPGRGNRVPDLSVFSTPAVASALLDPAGRVMAAATEGALPAGAVPPDSGRPIVEAALAGEADLAALTAREPDGTLLAAAPVRDARGRVVGALYTSVHAPYSPAVHARNFLSFAWGPVSTLLLLALLFAAAFGIVAGRSAVARFERISTAAARWGRGDFSVTVNDKSSDELGQLAARLDRMASELRGVVELRQDLAMVEERNRIARDLHDSVKQQMFALAMQIGAAQVTLNGGRPDVSGRLVEAEKLARSVQQELVAMIRELQPPAREGRPFADVLREYAADWARQSGIAAEVRVERAEPLPPAVEHAFFRVAQEALANVLRHSGASRVVVALADEASDRAVLTVVDDGRGFDERARTSGMGLGNMRSRIEELPGGRFSVSRAGDRGTRVEASCSTNGIQQRS